MALKAVSSSPGGPFAPTDANVTATGTNQAGAYLIHSKVTIFDTVPSGSGARLPPWTANTEYTALDRGANNLSVYPSSGDQIENLGTDNPTTIVATFGSADFYADTINLWRIK